MLKQRLNFSSVFLVCTFVCLILIFNLACVIGGFRPTDITDNNGNPNHQDFSRLRNCTVKTPKPASPFPSNFIFPNSSMPNQTAFREMLQAVLEMESDPDQNKSLIQKVRDDGYPIENHTIITEDGYILTYYRIPHGHTNNTNSSSSNSRLRPPVILQHGLFTNAGNWIFVANNDNLAYILANAGYDVWLGNARGTLPSQRHTNKSITPSDYWDFSWEEMGKYDIPAAIDYILNRNRTHYRQLYYIGHSMGTSMTFAGLSLRPEVSDKIKLLVNLAPVAYLYRSFSAVRLIAPAELAFQQATNVELFSDLTSIPILTPEMTRIIHSSGAVVCDFASAVICAHIDFILCGYDYQQTNFTALPLYMGSATNPTTLKTIRHYGQSMLRNQFSLFDYGPADNCKKYGQTMPPEYDVSAIRSKTVFMYGENDAFSAVKDVMHLASKMNQSNLILHRIPSSHWNHLDYMVGKNAGDYVATPILRYIRRFPL